MVRQDPAAGIGAPASVPGRRRRKPIPIPAPLATSPPPPRTANLVDLPRLRWAARCDDTQFETAAVPHHAHNEPELVYCTKGRIWIDVGKHSLEGRPGDLYVLPARIPHAVRSDGAWENVCVLYLGGEEVLETEPRTIDVRDEPELRRWLDDLCRLYDSRPAPPGPAADALLLAVLSGAAELERRSRSMKALHPRLAAAVDYLRQRPASRVAAADLARATRTSYSHLSALFRARFGCGPLAYHRIHRMQRAQALLLDPYVSVGEVAQRVGFDDLNYFVRVFRKTCGTSPNRWRKHRSRELDLGHRIAI